MGKTVLYIVAALVLGGLMVIVSLGIGLSALLRTEPGEISSEAFAHAVLTGFALYLAVLWALQGSLEGKVRPSLRACMFIASPIVIMYLSAEGDLLMCAGVLAFIAALPIYQLLVNRSTRAVPLA